MVSNHGPGLFVPKPSCDAEYQRYTLPDVGRTVRQRPLTSTDGDGDCFSLDYSVLGMRSFCSISAGWRAGYPWLSRLGVLLDSLFALAILRDHEHACQRYDVRAQATAACPWMPCQDCQGAQAQHQQRDNKAQ